MATFKLNYLSDPKILRSIKPKRLLSLLRPYAEFLRERGLTLPSAREADSLDYARLVEIVTTPSAEAPQKLLNALYIINELARPQRMSDLLAAADRAGIVLDDEINQTPADIALQIWLHTPSVLEQQHARLVVGNYRRYDVFQSRESGPGEAFNPFEQHIGEVELDLAEWFEPKQLGRDVRVFRFFDNGRAVLVQ